MHSAIFTSRRLNQRIDCHAPIVFIVVLVSCIGHIGLRVCRKIDDGVSDRVGASKGNDNALGPRRVRECDVATRVGEKYPRIPCLEGDERMFSLHPASPGTIYRDQLQVREFSAVTEALKWLLHASCAHTVRDIYKS